MRPSRQRSCQSFHRRRVRIRVYKRRALLDDVGAPRDWGGGGVRGRRGTAVFFTAGPVATDPDRTRRTRANPRVSKVPLARRCPRRRPRRRRTATAMTAELGQRVASGESLADDLVVVSGPRGARVVRSPTAGRARLSSRSPVGRTAAAERCPAHARRSRSTRPDPLDIAGTSARLPPRAARSVPPPPVFSTSPDASGDGEPNLLGSSRSSVAVAVGGRALDAPAAAVGKVGLVVL